MVSDWHKQCYYFSGGNEICMFLRLFTLEHYQRTNEGNCLFIIAKVYVFMSLVATPANSLSSFPLRKRKKKRDGEENDFLFMLLISSEVLRSAHRETDSKNRV